MSKVSSRWYSERVEREVNLVRWGTVGTPVLTFPTAGGDAEEIERFHLVGACDGLLEQGRIKRYSVDSVNGRALLSGEGVSGRQGWIQCRFFEFLRHEVVAAIRIDCGSDDFEVVAAGCSIGAFNALASICWFPDVFRAAVCMSGTYDLGRFFNGPISADFTLSSALRFVLALDGPALDDLRRRFVVLDSCEGANQAIGATGA